MICCGPNSFSKQNSPHIVEIFTDYLWIFETMAEILVSENLEICDNMWKYVEIWI